MNTRSQTKLLQEKRNETLNMYMDILSVYNTLIVKRLDSNNILISHPYTTCPNSPLAYYHLDLDKMIKTKISEASFMQSVGTPVGLYNFQ